jgi:apolipoprotein N-acyltransferase
MTMAGLPNTKQSRRPVPQESELGPRSSAFRCLLPALLTGGLLWLCHFPVAWGWLGWVALVPLLSLVRSSARPRAIYLSAWAGGLVFFVPALQWMRVADPAMYATWIALAVYCSLFVPAGVWLVRRLDRGTPLPLVLTVPLVWCALDFFRGSLDFFCCNFRGGFAWYFLGHTQHAFLSVVQIADLGGVYAVTFVVAAVNALVFEWLYALPGFRRLLGLTKPEPHPNAADRLQGPHSRKLLGPTEPQHPWRSAALLVQSAAVLLLVVSDLAYGYWRLGQNGFAPGPRVALVQGNVPQSIRNATSGGSQDAGKEMLDHYDFLSRLAAHQKDRPELIVWPETCFPGTWYETAPGVPPDRVPPDWGPLLADSRDLARDVPRLWLTNVLIGLDSQVLGADGKSRRYNSSILISEDGRAAGRYSKMHLVPFGEYLPFRGLPRMKYLSPYDFDYSVTPGEKQTRFALGKYHFGMVICYEDSDPYLARQYARPEAGEPPVDFLVNTSNDGWFDGTSEHEEHLVVARFRAIECRRPLLRAVNMGISAVIDGNGWVVAPQTRWVAINGGKVPMWDVPGDGLDAPGLPPARWHEFKKVAGVLTAVVPLDGRFSVYVAWGDWLPWACWAVVGTGLAWTWIGRRLRRQTRPGAAGPR